MSLVLLMIGVMVCMLDVFSFVLGVVSGFVIGVWILLLLFWRSGEIEED